MHEFEKAYDELITWTKQLATEAEALRSQVSKALNPSSPVPDGFDSRASMAELIFRRVRERIRDVTSCANAVEKAMGKIDE